MIEFAEIAALSYEDREIVSQVMADAVPLMTDRQRDCLALYLDGMTQEEVGAELGIDQSRVARHVAGALGTIKRVATNTAYLASVFSVLN